MEELSKGNQQKIQFIAAILHDPDVLIMDEPFSGLDPVNVQLLKEAFLEMRDRGKTLIFSTHQMETVEELCESIAIIDRGKVVVHGSVRDVKRAMGRRVVRLATDGDGNGAAWLPDAGWRQADRPAPGLRRAGGPDGTDPELILRAALERGERVTRFEIADPSLEEVFIEHVGRPAAAEEERHLAGPAPRPAPHGDGGMSDLFPNAWHVARREYLSACAAAASSSSRWCWRWSASGWPCCRLGIRMLEGETDATSPSTCPTRRVPAATATALEPVLDASAGTDGPDYVITTVRRPAAARATVRDGAAGRAAHHLARRRRRPVVPALHR